MTFLSSSFGPARGTFNNYAPTGTSAIHAYTSTTDTAATIAASAYFNNISADLQIGDAIYACGSDACHFLQVTAVTPNVTTTQFDNYSPSLTSGHLFVGSGLNVPTDTALSGDATLANTGVMTIANNAITTAKINAAAVTLAKLASGITPSHIIKFAGNVPFAGGATTATLTVAGVLNTDVGVAQLSTATNASSIHTVVTSANTITVTFSADPGASNISYQALRAAA